ncbi:hypothetical protein ACTFIZ_001448 [Dictyostelium cf. discoideum]
MQDSEQIKNQYMSVSLDDIVKANRAAKKGRGSFNKGGDKPTTTTTTTTTTSKESSTSPKLNVLETSLDDIVKSQKKPYIKKSQNQQHQQFKVTINNNINNNNNNNNKYNQPQFQNRGLFNRNQPQQQFVNSNNRFNKSNVSPNYIKKYPHYHNNSRLKNIPRTSITDSIDHKIFDPRGIRDYSQVKKPTTASMNDTNNNNTNNNNNADDADELEYDEKGNELSFSVKVVNLPKSIIPSDIAYMFGVIGSLKDFELDTNNSTATVIFKKKTHALASIERYSGVELDGSLLILYEAENPPKQTSPPTTTTTSTTTTTNTTNTITTTTVSTEESNIEANPTSEQMGDKEMEE